MATTAVGNLEGLVVSAVRQAEAIHEIGDAAECAWAEILGPSGLRAKRLILETFQVAVAYSALIQVSGVTVPKGMLLYGPPGTGKTSLARGCARECGMLLLSLKCSDVLQKYVGASEKVLRDTFTAARAFSKPALILLDEIENIAPQRGRGDSSVTDRVVNQLLTFLDGAEDFNSTATADVSIRVDNEDDDEIDNDSGTPDTGGGGGGRGSGGGGQVYLMATTTRPDLVDAALLRPGRIEKHIYIGPPRAQESESVVQTQKQKQTQTQASTSTSTSTKASVAVSVSVSEMEAVLRDVLRSLPCCSVSFSCDARNSSSSSSSSRGHIKKSMNATGEQCLDSSIRAICASEKAACFSGADIRSLANGAMLLAIEEVHRSSSSSSSSPPTTTPCRAGEDRSETACSAALEEPYKSMDAKKWRSVANEDLVDLVILPKHLDSAFARTTPGLSPDDVTFYRSCHARFANGREPALPAPRDQARDMGSRTALRE
jgi:peroxin-1